MRNTDTLALVVDFLGVQPSALENVLSYRTKMVKKELCTIFLDPDGASDNHDDLAKTLYSLLFAWLNDHINQHLCRDDFDMFIGLFDLPGPQNLTGHPNSLDQFCINFTNERLHHFIQRRLFEAHRWGNHSSFKLGAMDRSGFATFTVNHFNGPVTYSSEGFLECNLDALNPDFVALLRGTSTASTTASPPAAGAGLGMGTDAIEGAGSINPFVKGPFSGKAIATQAHPKSEDTIVAVQQPVKPMRAPSTRRKGTMRHMPVGHGAATATIAKEDWDDKDAAQHSYTGASSTGSSGAGAPCVAGEFCAALDTLFNTLSETQTWYIFCINPNDAHLPNQLEGCAVKVQVRS
ncbi:hypothetical protein SCLCIDRAFT_1181769 [Scleroderma citrinum Foug A]|uniref:Myosin motor domain-containing protein n=1 Tax=Scleroderma citrinum Foug A TaxID=1036808 RepID=A0A0C2ZI65_9AGAM|nr:hypothetical protein SCLCIDRAFT_1181769 [Scleroderma citrinum Foug A]